MNETGYLLNGLMIFAIFRQLRGRRLVGMYLAFPLIAVTYVATTYLHTIPTSGNSVVLVALGTGVGLTLGVLCGLTSLLYTDHDGVPFVRATGVAAALWVLGVGARLGFALYAEHGGGPTIVRFSAAHALSMHAWVGALVLMALSEVVSRTLVLLVRSRRLAGGADAAIMAAS
jgi:hypothetical protein